VYYTRFVFMIDALCVCFYIEGMKPEPIYRQIGGIVRALRRRADIAQDALAGRLGISRATLANIETGRQRILVHQLYAIAHTLGVRLTDLLPPPPTTAEVAAEWANLTFEGNLNTAQKQQVAKLIGPMQTPTPQQPEQRNVQIAETRRNTRSPRRKAAR